MNELLRGNELHGWEPNACLSIDENFMDLCMIITRSSKLKQGSMACILVNEITTENDEPSSIATEKSTGTVDNMCDAIISVANNRALFSEASSDVHAEIAALGEACRSGVSTENATAYITMPPCKNCFGALTVSGIRRIVTRYGPNQKIQEAAIRNNIKWVTIANHADMMARVNAIVCPGSRLKKRKKNHS